MAAHDTHDRPPWDPLPKDGIPTCDTNSFSKVDEKFFALLYPDFCSAVSKNNERKPLKKTLNGEDYKTSNKKSKRSTRVDGKESALSARTPPVNPDVYQDYGFNFEWTGSEDSNVLCYKDCNDAFNAITASPCASTKLPSLAYHIANIVL